MKMKKIVIIYCLISFIVSCNDNIIIDKDTIDQETKSSILTLEIKTIEQLPAFLSYHTENKISYFDSNKYKPKVCESFIVSYYESPLRAIYTPLYPESNETINMFHVYFELESMISNFDLIITEEKIGSNEFRYKYLTKEGNLIVSFDVSKSNGRIFDFLIEPNKSWTDRFGNCVDWTFDNMNRWDYLACMAVGPVCAGIIASMCAVAASEGMFITADQP